MKMPDWDEIIEERSMSAQELLDHFRQEMLVGTKFFDDEGMRLKYGRQIWDRAINGKMIEVDYPKGRIVEGSLLPPQLYLLFRGGVLLQEAPW